MWKSGFASTALLIAGCSPLYSGLAAPSGFDAAAPYRPAHVRSWISPAAKSGDLLYVSTYSFTYGSEVYVLSWPALKLEGELSAGALGLCSDRDGNVYMAGGGDENVLEYAHGGSSPIKTLSDPDGLYAYGCSVDPSTGNLAVTNLYGGSLGPGNVIVYKHAKGTPSVYTAGGYYYYYFCGYGPKGELFIDGESANDDFMLAELPHGSSAFQAIALDESLGVPGNLQWRNGALAIGDQGDENGSQLFYEFSISASGGTETGSTPLDGAGDVPQGWIEGKYLAAPDTLNYAVELYAYPAGGDALATYTFGSHRSAFGATVSRAPRKTKARLGTV